MIIVSQDKDKIINHDNVQLLWINVNILNKTIKTFYIYADHDFLGEYETEERAKEVLQEIVKQKAIFEYFKNVPERTQILLAKDFKEDNEIFDTYEMPEK